MGVSAHAGTPIPSFAICYLLPSRLDLSTKLSITAPPNSSASDSTPPNNFCLA